MASSTLAIGTGGYELLDLLDSTGQKASGPLSTNPDTLNAGSSDSRNQAVIRGNGSRLTIKSVDGRNGVLTNLGLGIDGGSTYDNNNTNIFSNVSEFASVQGGLNDTLSIFGNVSGAQIFTDEGVIPPNGSSLINNSQGNAGNDLLRIKGNLGGSSNSSNRSTIYTDDGNDTIRIGGDVDNTDIFLGNQDDQIDIKGNVSNTYISTDGSGSYYVDTSGNRISTDDASEGNGNDVVRVRGSVSNTVIQTQAGNDTLLFGNTFEGSIEAGDGQDSIVFNNDIYNSEINTGNQSDTISILGNVDGSSFYLGNDSNDGDKLSFASNSDFLDSSIESNNLGGDTLIFGSGSFFDNTTLVNGSGADSLVFGSNSTFVDSSFVTGAGGDTLVFGSDTMFDNSGLNLGGSGSNRIYFASEQSDLSGLSITGATSTDTLIIGSIEYGWNGSNFENDGGSIWSTYYS